MQFFFSGFPGSWIFVKNKMFLMQILSMNEKSVLIVAFFFFFFGCVRTCLCGQNGSIWISWPGLDFVCWASARHYIGPWLSGETKFIESIHLSPNFTPTALWFSWSSWSWGHGGHATKTLWKAIISLSLLLFPLHRYQPFVYTWRSEL